MFGHCFSSHPNFSMFPFSFLFPTIVDLSYFSTSSLFVSPFLLPLLLAIFVPVFSFPLFAFFFLFLFPFSVVICRPPSLYFNIIILVPFFIKHYLSHLFHPSFTGQSNQSKLSRCSIFCYFPLALGKIFLHVIFLFLFTFLFFSFSLSFSLRFHISSRDP